MSQVQGNPLALNPKQHTEYAVPQVPQSAADLPVPFLRWQLQGKPFAWDAAQQAWYARPQSPGLAQVGSRDSSTGAAAACFEHGFSSVAVAGQQYGPVPMIVMLFGLPKQLMLPGRGVEQQEWSGMPVGAYRSSVTLKMPKGSPCVTVLP